MTYSITFKEGAGSDLQSLDSFGCQLRWSVSGSTASLDPNQFCVVTPPDGGGAAISITLDPSATVSLSVVDGAHVSLSGSVSGALKSNSGNADTCKATGTGTLVRTGAELVGK